MRLIRCKLENFGSYKELDFKFTALGLSLIHGPTGCGKSTLMDAVLWVLFGTTSKNIPVDDVKSWSTPKLVTRGTLEIENRGILLTVTRIRGKSTENDLYVEHPPGIERRKDIKETQKLINSMLEIDSDTYLSASYFCEFSPASTFFLDTPKVKRDLFEKLADLSFPRRLLTAVLENKKEVNSQVNLVDSKLRVKEARRSSVSTSYDSTVLRYQKWINEHTKTIKEDQDRVDSYNEYIDSQENIRMDRLNNFEMVRFQRITNLSLYIKEDRESLKLISKDMCPECGRSDDDLRRDKLKRNIKSAIEDIRKLRNETNPFREKPTYDNLSLYKYLLEEEVKKINPYREEMQEVLNEIESVCYDMSILYAEKETLNNLIISLEILLGLCLDVSGNIVSNSIKQIESTANKYLEDYFDSALKLTFSIKDSDSLDVTIHSNGYSCDYKQLSKGQRCLLKLVFAVAVMKAVSNESGVHFANLFFDEALDGMDAELKVKSFGLLQELSKSHESIMVIEHSTELKSMFNNKYKVSLVSDNSVIECE